MKRFLVLPLALASVGCVRTAVAVVKAPFQVAGAGIDMMTTSQEEADRNRGRAIRKQEEADAKAARKAEKERRKAEKAMRERDD
ncbi:hypothetical protein [Sandarakinorhabdus sp. DWP1-3-1]|uniref:hypothetical protein n=1 Tax=Sandarakinorhabdus sp. DWP1-3-1 TaxID=2804627 RepID=UPI003CF8CCFE